MEIEPKTVWAVSKPIITPVSLMFRGDTWEQDLARVLSAKTLGIVFESLVEGELYWAGVIHTDAHIISGVVIHINNMKADERVWFRQGEIFNVNPEDLLRDKVKKWEGGSSVTFLTQVV